MSTSVTNEDDNNKNNKNNNREEGDRVDDDDDQQEQEHQQQQQPNQNQNRTEKLTPLFDALKENDGAMLSFAEGFRDKVKILFDHFDHDRDGLLKYDELAALQTATNEDGYGGERLSKEMYVMACRSLNCHPDDGLSLEALKFTYAADGADIDADYGRVFDVATGKPRKVVVKIDLPAGSSGSPVTKNAANKADKKEEEEEKVYEIESNGVVDISS